MTLPIPIDRSTAETLQEQIYGYIRQQVLQGAYPAGMRLPSSRDLADGLKVSRNTVVLAYQWLVSEGYVETQAGAGTFVCQTYQDMVALDRGDTAGRGAAVAEPRGPDIVVPVELPEMFHRNFDRQPIDFMYNRVDPRQFPIKIWRRLIAENLLAVPTRLVEYTYPTGCAELREAIAEHLVAAKGINVSSEQIVVTSGTQEAMNLIARLFVRDGTPVGIESPGYASAVAVFRSHGAAIVPLPVDEEGVGCAAIAAARPKLVYTTPSHQFPTGVIMTPARRQDLLSAAEAAGAYVIEDDYDGEIIYDRPPIAALAATDRGRRVFYLGSFSKSLGAGLRIGFVVVPNALVPAVATVKTLATFGQPWLEQAVLATFIAGGSFASHLRRIRLIYRERRDTLIEALTQCFGPGVAITGQEAGLHLICHLPPEWGAARRISDIARRVGIGLHTPADAGAYELEAPPPEERRLVIGYANTTPPEIVRAFGTLASAIRRDQAGQPGGLASLLALQGQ